MAFTELAGDFADEGGWCTWSSGDGRTSASLPFLRPTAHGVLHFGGLEFAGEAATILGNLVSVDHLPVRDECNALEFYTSDDVLYAVSSIGERCFVFAEMQRILMTPFTPGAHDVDITFAPGSVSLGVDDGGVSFRIDDGGSPDGPSDADTIHGTVQELNLFALVFSDAGRGSFQRVALDDVSVYSCEPP